MAESPIKLIRERRRQRLAEDDQFFKRVTYFFELRVPESQAVSGQTSFLFPILLPQGFETEEPFTIEKTPTQGGGLVVEENGIVQRPLRIRGTTGFAPRQVKGNYAAALGTVAPDKKSYGRRLKPAMGSNNVISGQKHFQYLQDAIFRTYADLKRDPATSAGTKLIFHAPQDQEHWLVVPENFKLTRDKSQPHLYNYDIALTIVDTADAIDADFSEDKRIFDTLKDKIRSIRSGLDLAAGAFNDLTAIAADIESFVKNIATILDGVRGITTAASDFASGVTSLIESPYAAINATGELIEDAMQAQEDLRSLDITGLPDNIRQKFNQMLKGIERIGTHPEVFATPAQIQLQEIRRSQELLTSKQQSTLDAAAAGSAPTTLDEAAQIGTGLTPGDVASAQGELGIGREVIQYTGATEVAVTQGDTLVNLAAKYLGDARLWQHIAVLNGMKPPFVDGLANSPLAGTDEQALPGALGVGDKILIPNFSRPPVDLPHLPILGVNNDESAEVHLLGRDVALEVVGGREGAPIYGWAIDVEGGSVDVKTVEGVANLSQALQYRLRLERGTNVLYKRMGLERVIGFNNTNTDLELARFRVVQCVQQDPRVATVRTVTFTNDVDAVEADLEVALRGFTEGTTIRSTL